MGTVLVHHLGVMHGDGSRASFGCDAWGRFEITEKLSTVATYLWDLRTKLLEKGLETSEHAQPSDKTGDKTMRSRVNF